MHELHHYGLETLQAKYAELIREYSKVLFSDDRGSLSTLEERIHQLQDEISRRNITPPVFPYKAPPPGGFNINR
jgi:hypothetical protein